MVENKLKSVLDLRSERDVSRPQQYLASFFAYSDTYYVIEVNKMLRKLVKTALDIIDREGVVIQDEMDRKCLEVSKRSFDVLLNDANGRITAGGLVGPDPVHVTSWIECVGYPLLNKRLLASMMKQLVDAKEGQEWLCQYFIEINKLFIRAYIGFEESSSEEINRWVLMPYISISPEFFLPYTGRVTFKEPPAELLKSQLILKPFESKTMFILASESPLKSKFGGHYFDYQCTMNMADSGEMNYFWFSSENPGLMRLNRNIIAESVPTELFLSFENHQNIVSESIITSFVDQSMGDMVCRSIGKENGFALVTFLPAFKETVDSILDGNSIHTLASAVDAVRLNLISGTTDRRYMKYSKVFNSSMNANQRLQRIIDGPLKQACTQLMNCIDARSEGNSRHTLIWEDGTIGLLSDPNAVGQKPHIDAPAQISRTCRKFYTSSLSVIGRPTMYFLFVFYVLLIVVNSAA